MALIVASMGPSTSVDGEVKRMSLDEVDLLLQWGRRQASTERVRRRSSSGIGDDASMGPSTSVDGESQDTA